ncbi:MAG TPA: aminotransferase class V-fold PLP-dependent enzyme, partial [Roseiflexaceae bacterium]|nr:aminotransferase class V-fold PLP-dependent enzyme [Roseiflexaceae bacterium]
FTPTSHDSDKIAAIRAELPAVERSVYLNTGTNGPLPRRSVAALLHDAGVELEAGRIYTANWENIKATKTNTRAAMATLLGCGPDEIALTHSTTEGMNIALMGIDWQPGDELITARSEHEGGLNPVALIKQRYGATVHMTDIGLRDCDPIQTLSALIGPRTKAIVLSHVSWASGIILPMREISDLAHRAGALVICDAAQSCGMVPSNVYDLGVDAYACSGQKWLVGPDGTGAVFIRKERLEQIKHTMISYSGLVGRMTSDDVVFTPAEGAQRYEAISFYYPSLKAFHSGLAWIAEEIGWDWVYRRVQELGQYCYDALAGVEGVQMYLPKHAGAGLIHFTVDGIAPPDLTAKLAAEQILIRHTPEPQLNRVATGFYNNEADIDKLAASIARIRAEVA